MSAPRIAVVGSYATGLTMKVERIPSAGETLLGTGYRVDFGGKGSNQAVGCARLGAQVDFIAKIGKDSFGDLALGLYRSEGIDVAFVTQCSEAPTGVGFIVVEAASGQNSIVLDPGANELLTAADVSAAAAPLKTACVVLTQLEIPVAAAQEALARGRSAGAVTILNPAPVRPLPPSVLKLIDVLTPNETEAKVLAGLAPDAAIEPSEVGQKLIGLGVKQVVMTLGENGALLIDASSLEHFPAVQVQPTDTTGAGDAFNAGLATALANGAPLEQAVEFAVAIGAMAVTKEGVIPSLPRRDEALKFLRQRSIATPKWLAAVPPG
ncbi:MAG TPA: ribokinase [Candidatus Sulfotelmatobacter sp.]|nr:ribokinase [Candidatus Sulfotelmatobacter sp.]